MRQIIYLLLFVLPGFTGFAQQFLTGKIRKKENLEVLSSVSVYNQTQRKHKLSDEEGNYRIMVQPGDIVIFSCVGYRADTIAVSAKILGAEFPIWLDLRPVSLQAVTVSSLSNYQLDTLKRRQVYGWIYEQEPQPVVERPRPGHDIYFFAKFIPTGSSVSRHSPQATQP